MNPTGKTKQTLLMVAAVIFVLAVGALLLFGGTEHIKDTNGPEDVSLQTITEEDILSRDMGAIGGPNKSQSILTGDAIHFSADKFTGVAEILYDNFILPSDFQLDLTNYEITGGNFQLVVIHNDQIVAVLEPDMFVRFRLEDITGYVSLRIAGESAAFSFYMSEFDYNFHSHD